MNIEPLADRVLIEPAAGDRTTSGGVILPEAAVEQPQQGTVVAVGPGRHVGETFVPTTLEPGVEVVYSKYGGTEIELDGTAYVVIPEADVLAIVS